MDHLIDFHGKRLFESTFASQQQSTVLGKWNLASIIKHSGRKT